MKRKNAGVVTGLILVLVCVANMVCADESAPQRLASSFSIDPYSGSRL